MKSPTMMTPGAADSPDFATSVRIVGSLEQIEF